MKIRYKLLHVDAIAPQKMTEHSAGYDLSACLDEELVLLPGKRAAIPTGIAIQIPPGYEAQIRPRSGMALKYGIGVLNSPGTIDADYRGEIKIILYNVSEDSFVISHAMRIAQMIIAPVLNAELEASEDLESSSRQDGGFGHTGI